MRFTKEYVVRNAIDNQLMIRCPSGTKILAIMKMLPGSFRVLTEVSVTKNGGCKIPMSAKAIVEHIGPLGELDISKHSSDW